MYKVKDIALLKQVMIWTVGYRTPVRTTILYKSRGYCSAHAGQEQEKRSKISHFSHGAGSPEDRGFLNSHKVKITWKSRISHSHVTWVRNTKFLVPDWGVVVLKPFMPEPAITPSQGLRICLQIGCYCAIKEKQFSVHRIERNNLMLMCC